MSGKLAFLKKKINNINSIGKTARVMTSMSMGRINTFKNKIDASNKYLDSTLEIIKTLQAFSSTMPYQYAKADDSIKKQGHIFLTSDVGLCGSFNIKIFKELDKLNYKRDEVILGVVGSKGIKKMLNKGYEVAYKVTEATNILYNKSSRDLITNMFNLYRDGEISRLHVTYTHYKSAGSFETRTMQILPIINEDFITKDQEKYIQKYTDLIYDAENEDEIYSRLVKHYVVGVMYTSFLNSILSENTMRMLSMKGAEENAGKLEKKLTLRYNNVRKAIQTKTIAETNAASQAVNSWSPHDY